MEIRLVQIRCMRNLSVTEMLLLQLVEWECFGEKKHRHRVLI
jgi:hypothetical protein